ncbi:DUF3263 domain-containing protein [Dermatophilus congolensis]|uniref:DUF3263 domain-containing protein n=1 Tax=Dermatophilus congolensis TaxID=1863 RepID=UPI001AAEDDFB|nr:DUF3263 domain-containing protein [Dermatophilus congolensis]MBO3142862.1 DUF3263 domain-containing protein [Dermatophilus congolensis]MBO3151854.1 DUF3263 domain-containing protein [Dermatophilus congolensis]MBO3161142.1 DUF3263 domain-containing protein [Dermatophilus congolensis]MBO3163137.1 DUF3263 domain-containing protein [Dermatophilus congolensis]MBO3176692.1 DUF3263 domain-containing protein [Dermatophilus congolensis]
MQESRRKRPPSLSDRDRQVLELERKWGSGPSAQVEKLAEAQRTLGLDGPGYALVLRALLEDPIAYAHDPETIEAVRAVRDSRSGGDGLFARGGDEVPYPGQSYRSR